MRLMRIRPNEDEKIALNITIMSNCLKSLLPAVAALFLTITTATAQGLDKEKVIAGAQRAYEKAVKAVTMPAPGCAVGVSLNGETAFEKAFGLAEMEHNVPNTPQTIFESGSVAKQFTAAAVVLLSLDGKLSLDDPVRKYIPELPEYEKPITIRHILTHTAGLRDWGSVMQLTGAGRGDRVITQDIAFDVIVRQKNLDFTPGAEYSYSNSGYQLAAILVERVSKQKSGAFVQERLFKPLGMMKSSWRDDYQRLVPGRAQAYSRQGNGPWQLDMPFMNVVGNGGMLTTVGDWMKWNAMLDSRSLGSPLVESLETVGVLNDGRKITYALGLDVSAYKGIREVSHSGGTAGYQTFLARYPERKLSVAVLCNGAPPFAGDLARGAIDEILGPFPSSPTPPAGVQVPEEQLKKYVGVWRNEKTHSPHRIVLEKGTLRFGNGPMKPMADGSFALGTMRFEFVLDKDGRPVSSKATSEDGSVSTLFAEAEWTPTPADLASFAGDWYSEEAGAMFTFVVEGDKAYIKQRPALKLPLQPIYRDHFSAAGQVIWFARDATGKVDKLHVGGSRMRDMPFKRVSS
ncbi:MAG: serine hydrolase domain-containing protein [Pyrinomonadaceae bacterium]